MFLSDSAIDVSGGPGDHICIGLISFNPHKKAEIIKAFYDGFPELKHSRWKATKLGRKQLHQIISFLGDKDVRMFAVEFTRRDWPEWRAYLAGEALFFERIYAILYYKLLKQWCWRGELDYEYPVTICEESNINIDKAIETCRRLCRGGRINVIFSKSRAKFNPKIKFADYVAGALRKVEKEKLKDIKNYKIVKNKLQSRELNKAFRLYKKPELKKKLGI